MAVAVHYSRQPKSAIVAASPTPKTKQDFLTLVTNTVPFTWKDLDSPDYVQYIANLRKVGCTRETLIDIIVSEVNRLYSGRAFEILDQHKEDLKYVYWYTRTKRVRQFAVRKQVKEQLARLDDERQKLLGQLLGNDITRVEMLDPFADLIPSEREQMLAFLSEEKQALVKRLHKEGSDRTYARIRAGVPLSPEDLAWQRDSSAQTQASLRAALTAEEMLQYHARFGLTAGVLIGDLDGMNPSEEEFKVVLKVRYEFDEKWPPHSGLPESPEELLAYYREKRSVTAQLQELLGPERYADYQRSTDSRFQATQSFVENQSLPPQQAVALWELRQEINSTMERIRMATVVEDISNNSDVQALKREATQRLSEKLGPEMAARYLRNPGASWLNNLGVRPDVAPSPNRSSWTAELAPRSVSP